MNKFLEQQDAGPLPKPALAHMEECEACRALSADFDAIHGVALELGAEGYRSSRARVGFPAQPAGSGGIDSRFRSACAKRKSRESRLVDRVSASRRWPERFWRLILVAAAPIGYLSAIPRSRRCNPQLAPEQEASSVPSADSVFKEEVLTVGKRFSSRSAEAGHRSDRFHPPEPATLLTTLSQCVKRAYANNLTIEMAREYLYGAYQQKAELLATAMNRSMTGGLQ